MRTRRRLIAVTLLSCVCFAAIPSTATAGPLFDWLFQKNRSQGLSRTTAGYGAPGYGTGVGNTGQSGSCLTRSCLFGGNRAGLASNSPNAVNQLAARPNPNATTAGFAPQGSCGPGWCQQTVVRYVPQIAYRTAYQPVPVTTYKTSTTINPENGLPRTCTRPCTSYSYQARRVPYTTYQPMYTTVPVSDTFGQTANTGQRPAQPAPAAAGSSFVPNYAFQPPTSGGCSSCQNGSTNGYGTQFGGGFGGAPGYTPGNASGLPPAPQSGPWSNTPVAPPSGGYGYDPRGATPWQAAPNNGLGSSRDPAGATEWQPLSRDGFRAPPPQGNGNAADTPPSLRPDFESYRNQSNYGYSDKSPRSDRLQPVPMSESTRRRLNGSPGSSFRVFEPKDDNGSDDQTRYNNRNSDGGFASTPQRERGMFSTPNRSQPLEYGVRPELEPPANQQDAFDFDETRRQQFRSRAVHDLDRVRRRNNEHSSPNANDKTARRSRPVVAQQQVDPPRATRYTAVPIDWSQNDTLRRGSRRVPAKPSSQTTKRSAWQTIR